MNLAEELIQDEKEKEEIAERLICELGDCITMDDESLIHEWAFELNI